MFIFEDEFVGYAVISGRFAAAKSEVMITRSMYEALSAGRHFLFSPLI